jgi:hypothetical protein
MKRLFDIILHSLTLMGVIFSQMLCLSSSRCMDYFNTLRFFRIPYRWKSQGFESGDLVGYGLWLISLSSNTVWNLNGIISSVCYSTTLHKITHVLSFSVMFLEKCWRMSLTYSSVKKYGSCYSCSSCGTPHTNLLIMKEYFKILFRINTAPTPIVLNTAISTQMKPNLISKKCKFWVKCTVMYCLQRLVTKTHSLAITFFSYLNLSNYMQQ